MIRMQRHREKQKVESRNRMASPISIRVDRREFDATLKRYRDISKRTPKQICDTKAFFIARRAVLETPKADKGIMKSSLGSVIYRKKQAVAMKLKTVKRFSRWGQEYQAPLAALIINARRKKAGERGLYGAAMSEAIRAMLAARMRSIGFIKSGWLQAIKALLPFADTKGAPRSEGGVAEIGPSKKGYGIPASDGWTAKTVLGNTATTDRDTKAALFKFGQPALQRAFDAEERSMLAYIERKFKAGAAKAGVKTAP